jgi:hypothetical protein
MLSIEVTAYMSDSGSQGARSACAHQGVRRCWSTSELGLGLGLELGLGPRSGARIRGPVPGSGVRIRGPGPGSGHGVPVPALDPVPVDPGLWIRFERCPNPTLPHSSNTKPWLQMSMMCTVSHV